jgi:UDP-GlcNAc:undecaprenyl-phosphate GlcNAc-1-phosphate transferase
MTLLISALALTSFLLSLSLTPLCRNLARRFGLFDNPGDPRRIHKEPIPRVGGVAIGVSYFSCYLVVCAFPSIHLQLQSPGLMQIYTLAPAAMVMFATGLLDDLIDLTPLQKLAGQSVACLIAIASGVRIHQVGHLPIEQWGDIPITMLWLLAATNAFNLIDGIDGLAAGVGLLATVATLLAALMSHNTALVIATIPLVGALAAFLRYNFNPATIFLGDSGSLLIGFLLGSYGVIWSQKSATLLGMTAPLFALTVPLLEVFISILRRFLRRQPIFGPDRAHIHHRLLERGLTPRRVALLLYGVSAIFASVSLLASFLNGTYFGFVVIPFCAAVVLGVQYLGYVEFDLVRKMVMAGGFRRSLIARISLQSLEGALKSAATVDDVWDALYASAAELKLNDIELRTPFRTRRVQLHGAEPHQCLRIQVPLSCGWCVFLSHKFSTDGSHVVSTSAALFADSIRSALNDRIPALLAGAEATGDSRTLAMK